MAAGDLASPLPRLGNLRPAAYLEAENLAHRFGQAEADPDSSGGQVWAARRGQTEAGHIVFGPYAYLDEGGYLALFRLRRTGQGSGLLATLDTCVAGGNPQTGLVEVRVEDLPEGQWRWVPIRFDHPGGNYEVRVLWSAAASLAVDAIALWRVEAP